MSYGVLAIISRIVGLIIPVCFLFGAIPPDSHTALACLSLEIFVLLKADIYELKYDLKEASNGQHED